jgi:murein DD-endopeptidase MepM/ murein hydrolase activator NlpD
MDDDRPVPGDEADEQTRVRLDSRFDPRFDEDTRRSARTVVPLGQEAPERPTAGRASESVRVASAGRESVYAERLSAAARRIGRLRALVAVLSVAALILVGAVAYLLQARRNATPVTPVTLPPPTVVPTATPTLTPTPTPSPSPTVEPSPSPGESPSPSASPAATQSPSASPSASPSPAPSPSGASQPPANSNAPLVVPVQGVRPDQLQDTYTQSRSEGRVHNAIDIMAPKGTPVVAAADGTVVKLFQSARGGITTYVLGTDNRTIYYYAHLERYADGLAEKKPIRRGELVGYVGDTGNAGAGNYHLHFEISVTDDPKRWYSGQPLNPYPLLTGKR